MGSAGWDEVLGGGAGDGGVPPDEPDDDIDEDEAPPKKRIKTSTKVFLVVAGWLLLTLFLVGQFSKDKGGPSAVANLDTVAQGAEAGEPEVVDTEEEEALDADGDGFLSAEEQGL
jgi:hypothetical protein